MWPPSGVGWGGGVGAAGGGRGRVWRGVVGGDAAVGAGASGVRVVRRAAWEDAVAGGYGLLAGLVCLFELGLGNLAVELLQVGGDPPEEGLGLERDFREGGPHVLGEDADELFAGEGAVTEGVLQALEGEEV